jgi:hypothetical protein
MSCAAVKSAWASYPFHRLLCPCYTMLQGGPLPYAEVMCAHQLASVYFFLQVTELSSKINFRTMLLWVTTTVKSSRRVQEFQRKIPPPSSGYTWANVRMLLFIKEWGKMVASRRLEFNPFTGPRMEESRRKVFTFHDLFIFPTSTWKPFFTMWAYF